MNNETINVYKTCLYRTTPVVGAAHWKSAKSFSSTPGGASVSLTDGTTHVSVGMLPPGGFSGTEPSVTSGAEAGICCSWSLGGTGCAVVDPGVVGVGTGCPR